MKSFLIYAQKIDSARVSETIKSIFNGGGLTVTCGSLGRTYNITHKKLFFTENIIINIYERDDGVFSPYLETATENLLKILNQDGHGVNIALNLIGKAEAVILIECEKDYSATLDELFIKLTSAFNGTALLENGTLIDSDGRVIFFNDGTEGDSALLDIENDKSALPEIYPLNEISIPTKDEIIGRACAHLIISGYANDIATSEPIKESRAFYEGLINKYELEEYLEEDELALLYRDNISISECLGLSGGFNKAAVLLWFLSLTDDETLKPYGTDVKYNSMMRILASYENFDDLYDNSKLKSTSQLYALADKLQCEYNNALGETSKNSIENKYAGILWLCRPRR